MARNEDVEGKNKENELVQDSNNDGDDNLSDSEVKTIKDKL